MLISEHKSGGEGEPFVVIGHGTWVMPLFRRVSYLSPAMCEAQAEHTCVTTQGIQLRVKAVIAHKVGGDKQSIRSAGQRLVSEQAIVVQRAKLAEALAQPREKQLISQIVTPAEAQAQATKISAQAAAEAPRIQSEAAAANNRIRLDQQLIEQMPLVIQALAGGVAKADQTVLNGAE